MKKTFLRRAALPALLAAVFAVMLVVGNLTVRGPAPARAQPVPSYVGPYNIDLTTPLITITATSGNVNSATQANINQSGVVCSMYQSANTGTTGATFSIQGFDTATNQWFTYATSGPISETTETPLFVYPGAQTASLTSPAVASGLPLTRWWRVAETYSGTAGSTITAKIGCVILK